MHYYNRNIGDYAKKAGKLSMLEHGAYTLLIDACYDREEFPTEDDAIDWCWARTDEETAAVRFVLRKFFVLSDGRYVQNRIQEEFDKYREKCEKNAEIATKREEEKRNKARVVHDSSPEHHETAPNQEPRTNNHKPKKIKDIAPIGDLLADIDEQVASDFKALRSKLRAPITKTAMDGLRREAAKAELTLEAVLRICCERGWRGFKASWDRGDGALHAPPEAKFDPVAHVNRNRVQS